MIRSHTAFFRFTVLRLVAVAGLMGIGQGCVSFGLGSPAHVGPQPPGTVRHSITAEPLSATVLALETRMGVPHGDVGLKVGVLGIAADVRAFVPLDTGLAAVWTFGGAWSPFFDGGRLESRLELANWSRPALRLRMGPYVAWQPEAFSPAAALWTDATGRDGLQNKWFPDDPLVVGICLGFERKGQRVEVKAGMGGLGRRLPGFAELSAAWAIPLPFGWSRPES